LVLLFLLRKEAQRLLRLRFRLRNDLNAIQGQSVFQPLQRRLQERAEHHGRGVALVPGGHQGQGNGPDVRTLRQNRGKGVKDVPHQFRRPAPNQRLKTQDAPKSEAWIPRRELFGEPAGEVRPEIDFLVVCQRLNG